MPRSEVKCSGGPWSQKRAFQSRSFHSNNHAEQVHCRDSYFDVSFSLLRITCWASWASAFLEPEQISVASGRNFKIDLFTLHFFELIFNTLSMKQFHSLLLSVLFFSSAAVILASSSICHPERNAISIRMKNIATLHCRLECLSSLIFFNFVISLM